MYSDFLQDVNKFNIVFKMKYICTYYNTFSELGKLSFKDTFLGGVKNTSKHPYEIA